MVRVHGSGRDAKDWASGGSTRSTPTIANGRATYSSSPTRARAPFRVEYRLRRTDGVYRWAIDAASPRFGDGGEYLGYVGSVVDIDERKLVEQALSERSEEFYALADNIPALAWMAYADGNIFWYNRRWYDYTGTTAETQVGTGWEVGA